MKKLILLILKTLLIFNFLVLFVWANDVQKNKELALLSSDLRKIIDLKNDHSKKQLDEFLENFMEELERSNVRLNALSRLIKKDSYLNVQMSRNKNGLLHLLVQKLFYEHPKNKSRLIKQIKKFQVIARLLLERGANPNLINAQNETALHLAIRQYRDKEHLMDQKVFPVYLDFIQILISHPGVSHMDFPELQENPLVPSFMDSLVTKNILPVLNSKKKFIGTVKENHVFLDYKRKQILKMMLERGFDINEYYEKKKGLESIRENYLSNLFSYEQSPSLKTIEEIKETFRKSANPNLRNHQNESLLHLHADIKKTYLLLENGADPNLRDHNGETALFRKSKEVMLEFGKQAFVERNHYLIRLKMLLDKEANPHLINHKGESFLDQIIDYYKESKKEDFRKLFLLKVLKIAFFHNARAEIYDNQNWAIKFLKAHEEDLKIKADEYKDDYSTEKPPILHPYYLFEQLNKINFEHISFFIFSSKHLDSKESFFSNMSYFDFFLKHTPREFKNQRLTELLLERIIGLDQMEQGANMNIIIERLAEIIVYKKEHLSLSDKLLKSHPHIVKKIYQEMSRKSNPIIGAGHRINLRLSKYLDQNKLRFPFMRWIKK